MRRALVAFLLGAFGSVACTRYEGEPESSFDVPSRAGFESVHAVLGPHCGTLDCHGSPARNFRVYGVHGLRADGNAVTGSPDTTDSDVGATYESIVLVDPEALSTIHHDQGRRPERWIVIMKARGLGEHAGGTRLPDRSDGDRCLVSWIAGALDETSCNADIYGPLPRDGGTW